MFTDRTDTCDKIYQVTKHTFSKLSSADTIPYSYWLAITLVTPECHFVVVDDVSRLCLI
jgi:hypothetical protein